jgi:hypothetical protein
VLGLGAVEQCTGLIECGCEYLHVNRPLRTGCAGSLSARYARRWKRIGNVFRPRMMNVSA